jgi:predicted HicB family RNase H-like nuclease
VSLRTEGYIVQSIRMNVDDNNDVRMAADKAGMSINSWVVATLREAATTALKKKRTTKNGKASS